MSEITHPSQLPAVDKLLQSQAMPALRQSYGQDACTQAVREVLAQARSRLLGGEQVSGNTDHLLTLVQQHLVKNFAPLDIS